MSVTQIIVIITCLVSIPAFNRETIKENLLFWPYEINHRNQYYRFVTCGLIHGDSMHLIFNMVSLYSFGVAIETFLFPVFFKQHNVCYIYYYTCWGLFFPAFLIILKHRNTYGYRALGASGAVSAVIFSAIFLEPNMPFRFFFIPIDIPGYFRTGIPGVIGLYVAPGRRQHRP